MGLKIATGGAEVLWAQKSHGARRQSDEEQETARTPPEGSTRKLCHSWRVFEEVSWLRSTEQTAGQAAGLPTSFLELFSFWQRKKWNVPLYQKENFIKSPVCAQKRNTLFILKIFRVGKILLFSHSITACLQAVCLAYPSFVCIETMRNGKVDFEQFPIV